MFIRKYHRLTGLVFAIFFLITACTGMILLWRKAGIYDKGIKEFLLGMHNWEMVSPYIGVILGGGLLFMSITGIIMFIKTRHR